MTHLKNKLGLIIVSIMIILASCNKAEDNFKEGSFKLQQITYLKNNTEQVQDASINFNLGDIYASKEFYFMLSNAGDYPITNINIITNNEQFIISPAQIDTLSSANDNSFTQAITLGILHGKVLNGVESVPNLQQGENTATLTITGTTFNGREYVDISFEVEINIVAKIADISVSTSSGKVNMEEYCHTTLETEIGYYVFCINPTEFVTFQNCGNVNLELEIKYNDTITYEYQTLETNLISGESYTFNKNDLRRLQISFTGENAVVNQDKYITTDNDGINYFGVYISYDE